VWNLLFIIYLFIYSVSSVGRPQPRWSDDLRRTAGKSWMRVAEDRARWQTASWSSGLRYILRNQRSRVQIPVVGRGFSDEQLHLLTTTSHGVLCIIYYQCNLYVYEFCIFISYLVSITQVLKDT
jgi:hypothetical protein